MTEQEFVWPDERITIEYYGDINTYAVHFEEASSKPVHRVVPAGDLLAALRDVLPDDAVWDAAPAPDESQANSVTEDVDANEMATLRLEIAGLRARLEVLERKAWPAPYQPYSPNTPYIGGPYYGDRVYTDGMEVVYKTTSDTDDV